MNTEAVKTRVFDMAPVTQDAQLHEFIDLIAGVLHHLGGGQKRRERERE